MDMPQSRSPGMNKINRLLAGSRSMREIQRQVRVLEIAWIPTGHVRLQLSATWRTPWIHVLDAEHDPGVLGEVSDPLDEASRIVALPAKRRMHHNDIGVQPKCRFSRSLQLHPRISTPYPLRDQQARRVDGQHGHAVVVAELLHRVDV